jgi:alpha-glucoside transport system substrate-binding protein
VVGAIEEFGWFARNDDFVAGGAGAVASTDFRDSPEGPLLVAAAVLHAPPGVVHPGLLPGRHRGRRGCRLLLLPGLCRARISASRFSAPARLWAITNENQAAHDLIAFLQTPEAHEVWMAQKGFLTPVTRASTRCLLRSDPAQDERHPAGATTFRFDGSDLMPGGVGAGSFWTGMVDYTGGKPPRKSPAIQKSWDALK